MKPVKFFEVCAVPLGTDGERCHTTAATASWQQAQSCTAGVLCILYYSQCAAGTWCDSVMNPRWRLPQTREQQNPQTVQSNGPTIPRWDREEEGKERNDSAILQTASTTTPVNFAAA